MNELQQCYYNSCAMQTSHSVSIPHGMFAVVIESPDYCGITDAMLPNPRRSVVRLVMSERIANHIAAKLNAQLGEDDYEAHYAVFPKRRTPPPARTAVDEWLPF